MDYLKDEVSCMGKKKSCNGPSIRYELGTLKEQRKVLCLKTSEGVSRRKIRSMKQVRLFSHIRSHLRGLGEIVNVFEIHWRLMNRNMK